MTTTHRQPELQGEAGSAFLLPLEPYRAEHPEWSATLASWFFILPRQSPAWDKYQLSVVHLREAPGVPPAVLNYPGAEYEIHFWALDPQLHPAFDVLETWRYLEPTNYVSQFGGVTDEKAIEACEEMARHLVRGHLPAEPQGIHGARELWKTYLQLALGAGPDAVGWNAG